LLKDRKVNPEKIRVLDLACGSGSFLIKAFDVLNEYYREKDKNYNQTQLDTTGTGATYTRKLKIMHNNIFGVDLDKQAVEITQLNLLLKIAEKGQRLPLLEQNIKCGNSLIDDSAIVGGKAFKWEEEFKQIMDGGGFDVIIGNPPYFNIQTIEDRLQKEYFKKEYKSHRGKADVLYFFIERANDLLNAGGYLGFIVANYFLRSHYADKLRDFILKYYEVVKIIDFGSAKIFGDANVDTCILILRKLKHQKRKFLYGILINDNQINEFLNASLKKKATETSGYKIINESQSKKSSSPWHFGENNISNVVSISEICHMGKGAATGNDNIFVVDKKDAKALRFECDLIESLIDDSSIDRYVFRISDKVLIKTKRGTDISKYPNIRKYLENHKEDLQKRYAVKNEGLRWHEIVRYNKDLFSNHVLEQIYAYYRSTHNKFAYSDKRFVTLTTTFVLTPKKTCPVEMKYLLGILNSKFMDDYSNKNAKKMGSCFEYSSNFIGSIPIKILAKHERQPLINLVDKMLLHSKHLKDMGEKRTDEVAKIKEELKKTDVEIDEFVDALYNKQNNKKDY